jgi:SAM-dependent methyltransferase
MQSQILSPLTEKKVYDTHHNDVNDPRYQAFVSPVTSYILSHFNKNHKGLDFGSGPGPVIAEILRQNDFQINLYDPYYHNNLTNLEMQYDYIIACEVIEHFNHPSQVFNQLSNLIRPNGSWVFFTWLYDESIDFNHWHYKNDETHVIFYTKKTLNFIKKAYHFDDLYIQDRLIVFKKKIAT